MNESVCGEPREVDVNPNVGRPVLTMAVELC